MIYDEKIPFGFEMSERKVKLVLVLFYILQSTILLFFPIHIDQLSDPLVRQFRMVFLIHKHIGIYIHPL